MNVRPIPVTAARGVAKRYGYDQVVIMARKVGEDGVEHVTTYGVDKANCIVAAAIGDHIKHDLMKWPVDRGAMLERAKDLITDEVENGKMREFRVVRNSTRGNK